MAGGEVCGYGAAQIGKEFLFFAAVEQVEIWAQAAALIPLYDPVGRLDGVIICRLPYRKAAAQFAEQVIVFLGEQVVKIVHLGEPLPSAVGNKLIKQTIKEGVLNERYLHSQRAAAA